MPFDFLIIAELLQKYLPLPVQVLMMDPDQIVAVDDDR
jgi:hypothetical protein